MIKRTLFLFLCFMASAWMSAFAQDKPATTEQSQPADAGQDPDAGAMRRILAPAGYGSTHPDATNSDPQGRALNRRVDVMVLVNKGLQE
jgi:hypothetical protein